MGQQMYYRITKRVGQEKTIIVFSCFYFLPLIPERIRPKPCRAMAFGQACVTSHTFLSGKGKCQDITFPLVFAQAYAYQEVNFSLYLHRVTLIRM